MATKRRLISGAAIGGILVVLIVAAGAMVAGFLRTPSMADQATFPARYAPSTPADGTTSEAASILLMEGGSGEAVEMPAGELRVSDEGACVESGGALFTGDFTWRSESEGVIKIESSQGQALLLADPDKFGTWSWLDVAIPLCGNAPARFGLVSPPA